MASTDSKTATRASVLDFLKANTFLGALPEEALDRLFQAGHTKGFAKGQTIYQRGDPGDYVLVILSGRIKITNIGPGAREMLHNVLAPGDVHGEIALLDGGERTATATALEDTQAFLLFRRDLIPILRSNPDSLLEIVTMLCERVRHLSQSLEDAHRSMQGRLVAALLRLVRQHGRRTKEGVLIDLDLTQRDLGNYAGLSRENTSRLLAALSRSEVLALVDNGILVKSEADLEKLAEDDVA
jgi:CRP/FNR family transcriptional regulator, cyclic AMP receptor protein